MKTNTRILTIALLAGVSLVSCKKGEDKPSDASKDSTMQVATVDSLKMAKEQWQSFKSESEQKIKNIDDSLAMYESRMKKMDPKTKAAMENARMRSAAIRAQLAAPRDEAQGSFQRAKDGIVGGIDSLGASVTSIGSSKKK